MRVIIVARPNQHEPLQVDAELAQAMRIGPAMVLQRALGHDEHRWTWPRLERARHKRKSKANGGWTVAIGRRHDFMQDAQRETVAWQMVVNFGQSDREQVVPCLSLFPLDPGDGLAQGRELRVT